MTLTPATGSACPLCAAAGAVWIESGERRLIYCAACRFAWIPEGVKRTASGASIYEDASALFLDDAQADYYRDDTTLDAAREKLAWVSEFVPPGATLLDVGANIGLFVREAAGRYSALGIEPSPAVVQYAREHTGAAVETASIDDDTGRFDGRFDALTLFDVIEHLPDPRRALAQCRRFLRPGGHLFLTTPDIGSLAARLAGRHWHYIDMDEHVALFSRASLGAALGQAGFDVKQVRTSGRSYRFSYIRRRLRYLGGTAPALRLAYLASWPLEVQPSARVHINLGDVMRVVAVRRD